MRGKGIVVPVHVMMAYWRLTLTLPGGVWFASCTKCCAPARLGMPQSWSGGFGEEKSLLPSYDRCGEFFFKGANNSRGHSFHDLDFASLFHCPIICLNKHVMKCEVEGQWGVPSCILDCARRPFSQN